MTDELLPIGHLASYEPTLYEQCQVLRVRARRLDGMGAEAAAAHVRRHLGWLEDLRRRQLEDARRGPDLVALPPDPVDVEAEQAVIGAVLYGDLVASETRLLPRHYSLSLHRLAWAVLLTCERPQPYHAAGRIRWTHDWRAGRRCLVDLWRVSELVHELAADVPDLARLQLTTLEIYRYLAWQREHWETAGVETWVARLRSLARRRWLLGVLLRLEAEIRAGRRPAARLVDAAARVLRRVAAADGA